MKSVVIILLFLITITSCQQELTGSQVPKQVQKSFFANFPQVQDVDWKQPEKRLYEAEFSHNQVVHKVQLDHTGKLLLHKQEVTPTELPTLVKTSLSDKQKGARLETLEKVQHGSQTYYQAELRGLLSHMKYVFKADGLPEHDFAYWE